MGRYGLYLKDDKCVNHKLEKKLWSSFIWFAYQSYGDSPFLP
jgi:hypothetical protein